MTPDEPEVRFHVRGEPVGQGGMTAFVLAAKPGQKPRAKVAHKNAGNLYAWRTAIADSAQEAMGERPPTSTPVRLFARFTLPRLRAHFGARGDVKASAPVWKPTKPDIDKLLRSLLDGMTGVVWLDDAQVVVVLVEKRFGDVPGVEVEVRYLS